MQRPQFRSSRSGKSGRPDFCTPTYLKRSHSSSLKLSPQLHTFGQVSTNMSRSSPSSYRCCVFAMFTLYASTRACLRCAVVQCRHEQQHVVFSKRGANCLSFVVHLHDLACARPRIDIHPQCRAWAIDKEDLLPRVEGIKHVDDVTHLRLPCTPWKAPHRGAPSSPCPMSLPCMRVEDTHQFL